MSDILNVSSFLQEQINTHKEYSLMCGYQCVFIISVNTGTLDTAHIVTLLGSPLLALAESDQLFADLHECMSVGIGIGVSAAVKV